MSALHDFQTKAAGLGKDPIDVHIGSRLRLLRSDRQMTLQEAGNSVGITYQQIRKYESGDNRVSASTLYRLSRLFGVDPSFFFDGLAKAPAQQNGADRIENPLGLQDVLSRIEDTEVRTHLERLIITLEKRKREG